MPSADARVVLEAGSCLGMRELDFLLDLQELVEQLIVISV